MIVILLTACIHPKGMFYTALNNPKERSCQYTEALDFYLKECTLPLVFCENTGVDLSDRYANEIANGRMEYLTFDGNNFEKSRGKGYGEMEIIAYAFTHSNFIHKADEVMKITGRLKITNLNTLLHLHQWLAPHHAIQVIDANATEAFSDSRLVLAPNAFFEERLIPRKDELDDSHSFWMEHLLYSAVAIQNDIYFLPFPLLTLIQGTSGSTGQNYQRKYFIKDYLMHAHHTLETVFLLNSSLPFSWKICYKSLLIVTDILLRLWSLFRP